MNFQSNLHTWLRFNVEKWHLKSFELIRYSVWYFSLDRFYQLGCFPPFGSFFGGSLPAKKRSIDCRSGRFSFVLVITLCLICQAFRPNIPQVMFTHNQQLPFIFVTLSANLSRRCHTKPNLDLVHIQSHSVNTFKFISWNFYFVLDGQYFVVFQNPVWLALRDSSRHYASRDCASQPISFEFILDPFWTCFSSFFDLIRCMLAHFESKLSFLCKHLAKECQEPLKTFRISPAISLLNRIFKCPNETKWGPVWMKIFIRWSRHMCGPFLMHSVLFYP